MRQGPTLLLIFLFAVPAFAQKKRIKLPDALKEVSGMVRLNDGTLWMHNDSRNPPVMFRYDPMAEQIVEKKTLPLPNRDWEDITVDPSGKLYLGDFGNNGNARRDLRIYIYQPYNQLLDSILFVYPDQTAFPPQDESDWNFNCEAMVFWNDSLHLFSKNVFKGDYTCKHYVLPAQPGLYTAVLRDKRVMPERVVTGAALSHDGRTLALTGYTMGKQFGFLPKTRASVLFLTDWTDNRFLSGKMQKKKLPKCIFARQFESVTHVEGSVWLVANEGRASQAQALWRIKQKR